VADLTYNVFTGELIVRSSKGKLIIAFTESGFSNFWWDGKQVEKGKHGVAGHVEGGPIPVGRWRVHPPGARHPDPGRLRPDWIPVGPVAGRTSIYIHSENRTEGCINIPKSRQGNKERFEAIKQILKEENGGWITVIGGGIV